jgi:hypothetical protein
MVCRAGGRHSQRAQGLKGVRPLSFQGQAKNEDRVQQASSHAPGQAPGGAQVGVAGARRQPHPSCCAGCVLGESGSVLGRGQARRGKEGIGFTAGCTAWEQCAVRNGGGRREQALAGQAGTHGGPGYRQAGRPAAPQDAEGAARSAGGGLVKPGGHRPGQSGHGCVCWQVRVQQSRCSPGVSQRSPKAAGGGTKLKRTWTEGHTQQSHEGRG